jgi:hypothetical protein
MLIIQPSQSVYSITTSTWVCIRITTMSSVNTDMHNNANNAHSATVNLSNILDELDPIIARVIKNAGLSAEDATYREPCSPRPRRGQSTRPADQRIRSSEQR